jgi:hypothetical protein
MNLSVASWIVNGPHLKSLALWERPTMISKEKHDDGY